MLHRVRAKERAAASRKDEPQPASEDTARSVGRPVGRSVGMKQKRQGSDESSKKVKTESDQKFLISPAWPNGRVPPKGVTGAQLDKVKITSTTADIDEWNGLKANATECTASCYDLSATASGPATMQDSGREHGNSIIEDDPSDDDIFPCGSCSAIVPEPVLLCSHCRSVDCPRCRRYLVCDGCDAWICQPCLTEHRQLCRVPPPTQEDKGEEATRT